MVLNQNHLFDIQESQFTCFASCNIDNIWIPVFPVIFGIFDHDGGQYFCYKLKYPCDACITQYAWPEIDDP